MKFKIGSYQDEVLCDFIPMNILHMFLVLEMDNTQSRGAVNQYFIIFFSQGENVKISLLM